MVYRFPIKKSGCLGFVFLAALLIILLELQPQMEWVLGAQYLFWHYLIPVIVVALAVAALLFRKRAIALAVIAILCLTFIWPFASDLMANSAEKPKDAHPLKVVTFNWLANNPNKTDAYAWIRQEQPDIIAIEEFSPRTRGVAEGLYSLYPYRTSKGGDIIILSKYPIIKEGEVHLQSHTFVICEIDVNGESITVYGVHPPTLRTLAELAQRNAYLARASDLVSPQPEKAIMLGDFNTTRWDPYFRRLARRGKLHEEPRIFPLLTRMSVRHEQKFIGSPIDHILIKAGRLSNCHTGPALGSDHLPLICEAAF